MGKIKIYEIAKKLGLTSKEVLEMAQKLNIEAKSHMSGVEEDEAKKIENNLSKKGEQTAKKRENTCNSALFSVYFMITLIRRNIFQ